MAYLIPIHKPTSIRHALSISLLEAEEPCLVVAKSNQLQVYRQNGDFLALQSTQTIYGKITMLQKLRPASSSTDHLFVGTDRYTYFTLSWDTKRRRLKTEKTYIDTADNTSRDSQTGMKCLIDPSGQLVAMELYEGILTIIPIVRKVDKIGKKKGYEVGNLGAPASARISELCIRSAAFLYGSERPKLALLHEDGFRHVQLCAKSIVYTDGSSSEPPVAEIEDTKTSITKLPDQGASHIIPIPSPVCGLLILGESTVTYVDDENNQLETTPLDEPTSFVAWAQYDAESYLLADEFGRLILLQLELDGNIYLSCDLQSIGEISRASVLVPLENDLVFIGSHQGDSQVIKLDVMGPSLEVVQTISNIAPILDMAVMDMGSDAGEGQINDYSSGQARIVTASGAFQDGGLRSVRSGVGLEDQGILGEMTGIRGLFSLHSAASEEHVDTLVASFVDETRIFKFSDEGEVEEAEDSGAYSLSESTLLTANIPEDRIVQVTTSSVRVLDAQRTSVLSQWMPPTGQHITDASASGGKLLVAVGGKLLVVIDTSGEANPIAQRVFDSELQIACLTVYDLSKPIAVVGFWNTADIALLSMSDLKTLHTETVTTDGGGSFPRALLITQILPEKPPTLLVSMADGVVFNYSVHPSELHLFGRKSMILGTQPARLQPLPRGDGFFNVFATCEHPTVIYGSERRIVYSAVTADDAVCVCSFNSVAYPGSIVIATASDIKISLVDEERRTHVKDLRLHETVRRIAYSEQLNAFALGTIWRTVEDGREVVKSHIKLVDEVNFELLDTYPLQDEELVESVIRAELGIREDEAQPNERFVVGTGYLEEGAEESKRGRIIVFEVTESRRLEIVAETETKGACRCLGVVEDAIVAALVKAVVMFAFDESTSKPELVKGASYRTSTTPIDLAVTSDSIAVADLMKSVSILEYRRGKEGLPGKLKEIARHFQTAWGTAVAHVAEDTYLESDAEGNLLVLHQNRNGVTDDDRRRLEFTSGIRLGEMVNRIRRIDVLVSPDAVVIPRAFLATVEGSIYLFALISPRNQNLLMRLQANIAMLEQDSLGHIPFNKYRAFKSSARRDEEPFRFVDGELIERFLDCSETTQESLVEELDIEVDEVRSMVEGLRRLH